MRLARSSSSTSSYVFPSHFLSSSHTDRFLTDRRLSSQVLRASRRFDGGSFRVRSSLLPFVFFPSLTSSPRYRAIVERAIGISKQFEESSRARERLMRANETLPLTAQADAAFLLKLARLSVEGVDEYEGTSKKAQLLRTMETMRRAVVALKEHKGERLAAAGAAVAAAA